MILFVLLFYLLLFALVLDSRVHYMLLLYYVILGLITLILFAKDKYASKNGVWRIPEVTLYIFSLFGGWTGGVIGQKAFRHKTQKQPFKTFYLITIGFNLLMLTLLLYLIPKNH